MLLEGVEKLKQKRLSRKLIKNATKQRTKRVKSTRKRKPAIKEATAEFKADLKELAVNKYVAVAYENCWYPGNMTDFTYINQLTNIISGNSYCVIL